jgi:hypothetical protein
MGASMLFWFVSGCGRFVELYWGLLGAMEESGGAEDEDAGPWRERAMPLLADSLAEVWSHGPGQRCDEYRAWV